MISTNVLRVRRAFLLLAAMAFALGHGAAGIAAPAPVSFAFTGSTCPVYDLSGSYRFDQEFLWSGGPETLSLNLALNHDAAGRLHGNGTTTVRVGDDSYPATYVVRGRVRRGRNVTQATVVARLQGQDTVAGGEPAFSMSVEYKLEVSPTGLKGTVRGSARFADRGKGTINAVIAGVPLPPGVDGSWSVQMNIPFAGKISGTGAIQLPNGRSLPGNVAGDSTSFFSQVKLSGADTARGTTLNLGYFPQTSSLQQLRGKILGQSVVGAPTPAQYGGSQLCVECHGPMQQLVATTRHAQVGVGCEDCHAPAAAHAANYYDPVARPKVDLTGAACGTCHSGPEHPTYEEWSSSGHAMVVADMNQPDRINYCALCHSGSVRVSLLDGVALPAEGANVPIGCPTCHAPHQDTGFPDQLRNPLASTNDYALASTNFAAVYDPNLNLCAQCHNHRGASWTNSASAPHPSPQYNFLLGTIGELPGGSSTWRPGMHAGLPGSAQYSFSGTFYLTNQCVSCHMPDNAAPAHTASHTFTVDTFAVCNNCHPGNAEFAVKQIAEPAISNRVYQLKYGLDLWAATKAPAALQTNGVLAWEFTRPGGLIWLTNNGAVRWTVVNQVNFSGPNADGQNLIPENIRRARFNMYLVIRDGSFGVHNPFLATELLESAAVWVSEELNQ